MSLSDLKAKIIRDAEKEAQEIRTHAETQSGEILDGAKKDLSRLIKQAEAEGDRLAQERYQNIVTLANVEGRNKILSVKQEMLRMVFDEAHRHLEELSQDRFLTFARNILTCHPPREETRLMVGLANKDFVDEKFIDKINSSLKTPGKFILTENNRGFEHGFYLITDRVEVDLTFQSILAAVREELEMDIIGTLFGKG